MTHTDRQITEKNWFWIALMAVVLIVLFNRLLFTDQIIRASDVLTQLFWSVKEAKNGSFLSYLKSLPASFHADWDLYNNGGRAGEGGGNALQLLYYRLFVYQYFPFPSSISWLAVLSLLWGGIGTYFYCRLIGVSRFAAFAAGLLFAYCAENATLINAGHTQKIETISWFPWVMLYLEKALQSRRFYHYALTALMLAIQFFCMHWQISFYACIAVALYWLFMTVADIRSGHQAGRAVVRQVALGTAIPLLFLTTVGMSFLPTLHWAKQSERSGAISSGASSGGDSGTVKGIGYEEGMSWSMPPEEVLTYIIPGLAGYSRQEAGDTPGPGQVYYWGRMHFTQTTDYLGLLPWLVLPLCFLFRRDRYTWFYSSFMLLVLLMAMGKYTPVYRFMFDHLPGFATFRVPKMILYVFAFSAAVLMARGLDILIEREPERRELRSWLAGLGIGAALLVLFGLVLQFGSGKLYPLFDGVIDQPTRYQSGEALINQRYSNMIRETWHAAAFVAGYLLLLLVWLRRRLSTRYLLAGLVVLLLGDLWRVNSSFFVLCPPPAANKKQAKTDVVNFLEKNIGTYRMQPLGQDPFFFSDYKIPNVSAYVTVSERRYREFLDNFSIVSSMPDLINMKYLVLPGKEYEQQKGELGSKYVPVYISPVNGDVVLENKTVMPKAWLVPSVVEVTNPMQRLNILASDPNFSPDTVALVESTPPVQMTFLRNSRPARGVADIQKYENNRIIVTTAAGENTLLVLGEKYYPSWRAKIDNKPVDIIPVNHILRGVYLPSGIHTVEFEFYSVSFETGKWLTLASFAFFAVMLGREWLLRKKAVREG